MSLCFKQPLGKKVFTTRCFALLNIRDEYNFSKHSRFPAFVSVSIIYFNARKNQEVKSTVFLRQDEAKSSIRENKQKINRKKKNMEQFEENGERCSARAAKLKCIIPYQKLHCTWL